MTTYIDISIVLAYAACVINILYLMINNKRKFFDGFTFIRTMKKAAAASLVVSLLFTIVFFVPFARIVLNLLR